MATRSSFDVGCWSYSRQQVELLDRKRWNTRVGLASEIFSYREIFLDIQTDAT